MPVPPPAKVRLPANVAESLINASGSLAVGYIIAWFLYGVLIVQVYIFYLAFPRDRAINKWLVGVTFVLETAQVVVISSDMWETFVVGFGNPDAVFALHNSGFSMPIIGGTVGAIVQCFYAYRIRVLSGMKVLPILICIMSVIQCTGALMSGIRGFIAKDVRVLNIITDKVAHGLFNVTAAVCDLFIAAAMSYYLSKGGSNSQASTQSIVRRIIRIVVGTGALTATVAIVDQVIYQAIPGKGYFLAPAVILGKLYSNSMMVVFNSRMYLGSMPDDTTVVDYNSKEMQVSVTTQVINGQPTFRAGFPGDSRKGVDTQISDTNTQVLRSDGGIYFGEK